MKPKSLRQWVEIYENKTNDKADIPKGFQLFYLPTRGFMTVRPLIKDSILYIYQVCGDGKFWHDHAELMANALGFKCVATVCNRNIETYLKAFEGEILVKQNINGELRLLCQDSIGRKVLVTYRGKDKKGNEEYWVTQYLHEKATTNFNFIEGSEENDV